MKLLADRDDEHYYGIDRFWMCIGARSIAVECGSHGYAFSFLVDGYGLGVYMAVRVVWR